MTRKQVRAAALRAAIDFVAAQPGSHTMADVAHAYNFFVNLINIARLEDNTQAFPVQLPHVVPPRPNADPSQYTANAVGG